MNTTLASGLTATATTANLFRRFLGVALVGVLLNGAAAAQNPSCQATSGAQRASLVELFTSEGCDSCPPADAALARLGARGNPLVVPLSLHVDYWDYIGWRDPYARAEFGARHRDLVTANGSRTRYTPHFFVNGRERRSLASLGVSKPVPELALAQVQVQAGVNRSGNLVLQAEGKSTESSVGLFVAITENDLSNSVNAGENRGVTLHHSHVVRHWRGPVVLTAGAAPGRLADTWPMTAAQQRKGVDVVAFVQNLKTQEVLQVVKLPLVKPDTCRLGG